MTIGMQVDQRVSLAVSTVIFALRPHPSTGLMTLWLPLVRRIREPYEGQWALPGGPLEADEDLAASARHTLERTTGLTPNYLEQLYAFGSLDRSHPTDRRRRRSSTGRSCSPTRSPARSTARTSSGSSPTSCRRWPSTTPRSSRTHWPACAPRSPTRRSPTGSSRRSSPSRTCARCTKPCCVRRSTPPTSAARRSPATRSYRPAPTCKGTSHRPPALFRFTAGAPTPLPEERR